MYTDISGLTNKVENGGTTSKGKVTSTEFNSLVDAVIENLGAIRSITFNNGPKIFPDKEDGGNVNIIATENNYLLTLAAVPLVSMINGTYQVALGNPFAIDMILRHKYINGSEHESQSTPCLAEYLVDNRVVGTQTMFDMGEYSFDFSPYLAVGENQVAIRVSNGFGNVTTRAFGVSAIYLEIALPTFDLTTVRYGEWDLGVQILGSEAIVNLAIDGGDPFAGEIQTANSTNNYSVPAKYNTHGAHTILVTAAATSNPDVYATPIEKEYLYTDGTTTTPIIATSILPNHVISVYDTLRFDYWAVVNDQADDASVNVTVQLLNADGSIVNLASNVFTITGGKTNVLRYEYALMDSNLVGSKTVKITVNGVSKTIPITIMSAETTLSETIGYTLKLDSTGRSNDDLNKDDWSYGQYKVTFPEDFEFSDAGSGWRKDAYGNTGLYIKRGQHVGLNYKPFDKEFGMANETAEGRTGKTLSFEFMVTNCIRKETPILSCVDNNGYGLIVNTNNAALIIKGLSSTISKSTQVTFKEDSRMRLDIVIEGNPKEYVWHDYENDTDETNSRASMFMYVNGVYLTAVQLSDAYEFKQQNPVEISIGSDYCDMFLYTVRAYDSALSDNNIIDNYAYDRPTLEEKVATAARNDVYDYKGDVDYKKLRIARPDLPIMIWEFDSMPVNKTDWLNMALADYENPGNEDNWTAGLATYTHDGALFRNQGTSSMGYPAPYRNYDFRFDKGGAFVMKDGTTHEEYHLYPSMPGTQRLTFKKDFASSEMANNAVTSMLWNDMTKGIGSDYPDVLTNAQKDKGASDPTYRQANFAEPLFVFIKNPVGGTMTPLGMFNLINWKNDAAYLGFEAYTWEKNRAQCWEYAQNDDYFDTSKGYGELLAPYWDPNITDENGDVVGGVVNDIDGVYEARYPKDSPTNKTTKGEDVDFGYGNLEQHVTAMADESADIRRLHNWLWSTDQRNPTNTPLTTPYVDKHGDSHIIDNREYRLRKFETEVEEYLIIDSCLTYMIWKEVLWMCDSGLKNLNLWTMDGIHWGCMVRDADTGLGINNRGVLSYPYYLESTDWGSDDEGTVLYLNAGHFRDEILENGVPDGYSYTMAGQDSPLWLNLEMLYKDRLDTIYGSLYAAASKTKFNYARLNDWFNSHLGKWCEALYNYGKYQYITPTQANYAKAQGNKQSQREDWLYNAFSYRTSKYGTPESAAFRFSGTGCDLHIKTYIPLYVVMSAQSNQIDSSTRRIRCTDPEEGVLYPNPLSGESAQGYVYVYSPRLITDLGNLYEFSQNWYTMDMTAFTRLRYFRLGNHDDSNFSGVITGSESIDLSKCVALEYIDITRITGFQRNMDLRDNLQLREFYASGSDVELVNLPSTTTLSKVHLGANLRKLELVNIPNLSEFSIDNSANLETLILKNCGGPNVVNSYAIISNAVAQGFNLKEIDVEDVEWSNCNQDTLTHLINVAAKVKGHIVMETGSVITTDIKRKMLALWGNVDDPDNDLYIEYEFVQTTSVAYEGETAFYLLGNYQLDFTVTPVLSNSFTDVRWQIAEGMQNVFANLSEDGVLTVIKEPTTGTTPYADVEMFATDSVSGDQLYFKQRLSFYQPDAKYGDYVYSDGTYSSVLNKAKTVVGVCMWIDPEDKTNRIMVYPQPLTVPGQDLWYKGTELWQTTWDGDLPYATTHNLTPDDLNTLCRDVTQSDGFKIFSQGLLSQTELAFELHRNHAAFRKDRLLTLLDGGYITSIPTTYAEAYNTYLEASANAPTSGGGKAEVIGSVGFQDFYMNEFQPTASDLDDKFKAGNWVWAAPMLVLKLEWHRWFGGLSAMDDGVLGKVSNGEINTVTDWVATSTSSRTLHADIEYVSTGTRLRQNEGAYPKYLMCKF